MQAVSPKTMSEIKAWEEEIVSCAHTKELVQGEQGKLEKNCTDCQLTENLWACLTCGNLGCGRSQFGGIGGHGHGLAHFETTRHPVAVKIGTITPDGKAGNNKIRKT